MSITDELRKYADKLDAMAAMKSEHGFSPVGMRLEAIADRIDAEADDNERFRRDVEPFCDRLREAAAERADVTMYGVDYVALPVDADGVPIHMGDRLVEPEYAPNGGTVVGIKLYSSLDNWLVNCGAWVDPRKCRHYHKSTVEDVLREFTDAVLEWAGKSGTVVEAGTWSDVAGQYAAKLRLASDGDEQ